MIKFFRNIRKKLILENQSVIKNTNYFKYAIGEIVLVVIGILIALQINIWNEQRKTELNLKYKLNLLVTSLKNDRNRLYLLKEHTRFKIYALQHLLKLTGEQPVSFERNKADGIYVIPFKENSKYWNGPYPEYEDKEFVDKAFFESARTFPEAIEYIVFDELKSSGMFALIKNDSLKKALIDYYEAFNGEFGHKYIKVLDNWRREFIDQGAVFYNTGSLDNPLKLITDVPRFEASMKEVIYESSWICHLVEQRLNYIDNFLIEEIENQIAKLE